MRRYRAVLVVGLLVLGFSALHSRAEKKSTWNGSYAKYLEIPGAKRLGTDTCVTCHAEVAKNFQHAFHAQQGVECEDCHGNGSLHVDGGGDVAKIISFGKRPAATANGVCMSCHARDEHVRHWQGGVHAANSVRCMDCHQIHERALKAANESHFSFDKSGRAAFAAASVSPETNVVLRSRSETNEACLRCHQTERAQLSLPYHHPLREGKMSCADCHDPHGGATGRNLRRSTVNELCLGCHSQYRGPFAYQHPPVTESCLNCHTAHGSPNTNLLSVSLPALCLQCHAGHHNGASLPLAERCTNCHGSIHGTDVATPSGGSRFVDKGPCGVPGEQAACGAGPAAAIASHATLAAAPSRPRAVPSPGAAYALGAGPGAIGMISTGLLAPLSGGQAFSGNGVPTGTEGGTANSSYSITSGGYHFVDGSGYLGRVGEYDSLQQSAGMDIVTAFVSPTSHLTVVSHANVLSGEDFSAGAQLTAGERLKLGFEIRSFLQQQDKYPFYAGVMSPDLLPITDGIPAGANFAVKRRLGDAYARFKVPRAPVHLFVRGNWEARVGVSQLSYLDENATTSCGETCHFSTQFQPVNYTTRNVGGGADIDLGPLRLTWEHYFSSLNDRLVFPTGVYAGPFTSADEPPPSPVPVPPSIPAGNYFLDIPAPNQASTDSVSLNWAISPQLGFNGHISYTRLRDTLTHNPQNMFSSDETLNWNPFERLRVTADYHQANQINNFTPFFNLYGNVSYHNHSEGLRFGYELPKGFEVESYYRRSGTTRSSASLWPQAYSFNNTDLLTVVPSSFSNTTGLALRYRDHSYWSARAGYEWTGTHNPGYLIVPQSNNRVFANVTLTPIQWLVLTNDTSIILQNAFPTIALLRSDGSGLTDGFQRRNRFYTDTASVTFRFVQAWNLGLGYSYQQNNLATYMAFQNDSAAGYVLDQPTVPYKQVVQAYLGESTYTFKDRFGLDFRVTYNSARSDFRPNLSAANPALFGNAALITQGTFDPVLFQQALSNLQLGSTLVSQVIVPQWIGQSRAYYVFPHRFDGGIVFYYGSYRDFQNPNLNGVLRTFNVYIGRSW
jgi:predicted CXXCH cytochrome family protein